MRISFMLALALGIGPGMAKTLLLLPLGGDLDKSSDLATVNVLYRDVWQNAYQGEVRAPQDSVHRCSERECALKLAKAAKADEVVYGSLLKLGGLLDLLPAWGRGPERIGRNRRGGLALACYI